MPSELADNLNEIRRRIAEAAKRSGRRVDDVKLVAVSKTHPPDVLRRAIDAGAICLGENKVKEAESKIAELGREAAEWHLIGHLQSNKARRAVQLFDVIQSVDGLGAALGVARAKHEATYKTIQKLLFDYTFDLTDEPSARRAARAIDDIVKLAHIN